MTPMVALRSVEEYQRSNNFGHGGGRSNEEPFCEAVEGRGRPGPDGIWSAPGFDRPSGYCYDAKLGERNQQCLQQRFRQPEHLVGWREVLAFRDDPNNSRGSRFKGCREN